MDALIFPVVNILATLTLIGGIIVLALTAALLVERTAKKKSAILTRVAKHALVLMLIVAATATLGSLFLSEIAGWTPCKLCWFQRIFMYPQVVLLGIAVWKKDRTILPSILALSVIGILIATFHYQEQLMATFFPSPTSLEPCDATGVSCAQTYTFRYGYITVPMMALTAFALNTLGAVVALKAQSVDTSGK